jgi:carbamoyl-phosphate synthase large subunit
MNKIRPQKVLILGSGALKIGEAGEFDYSGSQAIKAMKEEGIATVLVNPNIATIQTSDYLADEIYFLPVNAHFVEGVIKKERPDGVLLGFGGQTALQCGLELERKDILGRYGTKVLGTAIRAIQETEDRDLFVRKLTEIGVRVPESAVATSVEGALSIAESIGYPLMLRIAYALGGLGSGVCIDSKELKYRATIALAHSPQLLIEEYLAGWKEVEYEVVRDRYDNCITVCNMENFDPMGIHTGESIVVAPSQTLNNNEYHMLRRIAIDVVRHIGVIGECNIQFALDPHSMDYRVIEVNARLSRSSALASKATGYPLAFVAAKLGLGYGLVELQNTITGVTTACFEPALDYVVVKIPRWDLQKFRKVSTRIGSGMKSVGEVMAIGRKFEEAFQKALRMLGIGVDGLVGNHHRFQFRDLEKELSEPTHERIFAISAALKQGYSVDRIYELTSIDKWFLYKIKNIVETAKNLETHSIEDTSRELLSAAKQVGFSDQQIASIKHTREAEVREKRLALGICPVVKQIDTLSAEYPAQTNYLYLTYNGSEDDIHCGEEKQVIMLGSGAYSIGSSVEFDWCCVNAVQTLKQLGYRTIIINYNPETVSTDYNECDKLYFDELGFETVVDIYKKEKALGIIVSMGGQIPNNLAARLHDASVNILGTSPLHIDTAEDRKKFSNLLDRIGIRQPEWKELTSLDEVNAFAERVGYPVLIRPSYVLSGAAMGVASNTVELAKFLESATAVSKDYPIVVSKFLERAKEIDFDAVARNGDLVVWALSEHVENAGVHSGDATLVLPPQRTYLETIRRVKKIAQEIARALQLNGPFNLQFIARGNDISVIECNVRASRSFPFVSKILKINFIDVATRVIMQDEVPEYNGSIFDLEYVGVKAPQFSFMRLDDADYTLGVEMASTGEVACLGDDFEEAFLKAVLSVGYALPVSNILLSTGPVRAKAAFLESAGVLKALEMNLYATGGTANFLSANGIETTILRWPLEREKPNTMDYLREGKIDLVINIPKNYQEEELTNDYLIRRQAVNFGIPLITNIQLAQRFVESISQKRPEDLKIKSWREYQR